MAMFKSFFTSALFSNCTSLAYKVSKGFWFHHNYFIFLPIFFADTSVPLGNQSCLCTYTFDLSTATSNLQAEQWRWCIPNEKNLKAIDRTQILCPWYFFLSLEHNIYLTLESQICVAFSFKFHHSYWQPFPHHLSLICSSTTLLISMRNINNNIKGQTREINILRQESYYRTTLTKFSPPSLQHTSFQASLSKLANMYLEHSEESLQCQSKRIIMSLS